MSTSHHGGCIHQLEGRIDNGVVHNGQIISEPNGRNALAYRHGKDLYGTLSDSIPHYKAFAIRDDQWGQTFRRMLNALMPQNFGQDGEVDWVAERNRYTTQSRQKVGTSYYIGAFR